MEKFSIKEIIEQAVRTERLGNKFYSFMAKKFRKDEKLKALFETLAEKELQHEKTFSKLRGKIKDEEPEGWQEVSEYLRAIVESEFFLGDEKSLSKLENAKKVEVAVKFAIYFEKETLLYYYAIRDAIKEIIERNIVEKIIEEEKNHIIWLGKYEIGLIK